MFAYDHTCSTPRKRRTADSSSTTARERLVAVAEACEIALRQLAVEPARVESRCRTRTSAGQTPVSSSSPSSPSARSAVNGFVTDATRNTVSGSHPTVSDRDVVADRGRSPATAGTDHSAAAASQIP